jgi:hypothetical protein
MKTYKLICPSIGHIKNFKANNEIEAAKFVKEHNQYHGFYGANARTFRES